MAQIDLRGLAHSYLPQATSACDYALHDLDISLEDGTAYALLGASGCGKTTLLNIVSGLMKPTRGQVLFDGRDVTEAKPRDRHIAQVFQFPVVYDTMTVYENLEFPLKNRGIDASVRDARISEVAEVLGLADQLRVRPKNLPLGAKQLIALGRGLVRTDVNAILFDEPLTIIDPQLKWQLRSRLKQLHAQFDVTMIYVTHDQTEALTFADYVMVMDEGRILQTGTAQDLYEQPEHRFVGHFVGSPGMNFLPCEIDGVHAHVNTHRLSLQRSYSLPAGKLIEIGIRPERVHFTEDGSGIPATLTSVMDAGNRIIATVQCQGESLKVVVAADDRIPAADHRIAFDVKHINVYADGVRQAFDS